MRPSRAVLRALSAVLALTACTGDPEVEPTATGEPDRPTQAIIGENIELLPGADLALRVGFEPAEDTAQVIVTYRPDTAPVRLCALGDLDAVVTPACGRTVGSGVREPVAASELSAIAVVLGGDAAAMASITIEFAEGGRDLAVAIPRLRAPVSGPCDDNACNPFFEVQPTVAGPFEARARWEGPPATLLLLQGSVRGRSQTATGIPYAEPARADGDAPLSIGTQLSAPAEYALVLRHRALRPGEEPLRDVLIEASFPVRSS